MRGLHKSKKVTWAPDVNLCQVRLFLSEESPSQVGLGAQDHLQAKATWLPHSTGSAADDILPPGFEGAHSSYQLQITLSEIPVITWIRPPRFVLNDAWQVVAGEESKEVGIESRRAIKMLEAVYPRHSAIPPNPVFPVDTEDSNHNDQQTPLIPITPIEDEDVAADSPTDLTKPFNVPLSAQPSPLVPGSLPPQVSVPSISNSSAGAKPAAVLGVESDVAAAASAAFSALSKGNEHGNMIDHELLIKILSNPKLMEKLVTDYGAASTTLNTSKPSSPLVPLSEPPSPPAAVLDPSPVHSHRMEMSVPSSATTSSGPFYPQPNGVGLGPPNTRVHLPAAVPISSSLSAGVPVAKDVSYYKTLIQQHGGERQEIPQHFGGRYNHQLGTNQEVINNSKSRDSKPKIMKPCIYFNSSRGCRHGANCSYQHDPSSQQRGNSISEVQSAKRMKMDREISS